MVKYRADLANVGKRTRRFKKLAELEHVQALPSVAPFGHHQLDSAAYAKLLDTLRKMGNRDGVNMPSFKNGVFAKLQTKLTRRLHSPMKNSENNATLNERADKHAVRLNNAEDVIIGLNNKTDGNSDRISNLEIVVASEAFDEVDTDDFNEAQRAAYENLCLTTKKSVGRNGPYHKLQEIQLRISITESYKPS